MDGFWNASAIRQNLCVAQCIAKLLRSKTQGVGVENSRSKKIDTIVELFDFGEAYHYIAEAVRIPDGLPEIRRVSAGMV